MGLWPVPAPCLASSVPFTPRQLRPAGGASYPVMRSCEQREAVAGQAQVASALPFPYTPQIVLVSVSVSILSSHGLTPLTKPKQLPVLMDSLSITDQSF